MKTILAMLLAAFAATANAESFDPLPVAVTLHVVDYLQTLQISESCHTDRKYHELNPILGECPTKTEVTQYMVATGLAMYALHEVLPERYKKYASYAWVGVEAGAVANNIAIGIKIGF